MFFIHLCKQSSRWKDVLDTFLGLHYIKIVIFFGRAPVAGNLKYMYVLHVALIPP